MNSIANDFRDCLVDALQTRLELQPQLATFISELEAMDCSVPNDLTSARQIPTVDQYLDLALKNIAVEPPLAAAVKSLAGAINWYQIFDGESIEPDLARGLVAGLMAGRVGLVPSSTIPTGLFLLAPNIHYQLHQHAALEYYFVLSGTLELQHGTTGTPFHVRAGEISVTPSNRVHSLTVGNEPCLIAFSWTGELDSPNWWWDKDGDDGWQRTSWERQPDASWLRTHSESVTEQVLLEAGEI